MEVNDIKNSIELILDNNKAKSITSIDLKNKSYIADYMIVASGTHIKLCALRHYNKSTTNMTDPFSYLNAQLVICSIT